MTKELDKPQLQHTSNTTAIVVNYNTCDLLVDCIQSLLVQGQLPQSKIIVVDNNSIDGSPKIIKSLFPDINLIENCQNIGFGAANNIALELVSTPYTLMINPDAKLLPKALQNLEAFLDVHENAALVGPKTYYPNMMAQDSAYDFPTLKFELLKAFSLEFLLDSSILGSVTRVPNSSPDIVCEAGWLRGACILARTDSIRHIKGFDEQFFLYSEEVDLQYRIKQAGGSIYFNPTAKIIHHLGASMSINPSKNYVELFKSKLQFARKHYGALKFLTLYIIWLSYNLIRIFAYWPMSIITKSTLYRTKLSNNLAATKYLISTALTKG